MARFIIVWVSCDFLSPGRAIACLLCVNLFPFSTVNSRFRCRFGHVNDGSLRPDRPVSRHSLRSLRITRRHFADISFNTALVASIEALTVKQVHLVQAWVSLAKDD